MVTFSRQQLGPDDNFREHSQYHNLNHFPISVPRLKALDTTLLLTLQGHWFNFPVYTLPYEASAESESSTKGNQIVRHTI